MRAAVAPTAPPVVPRIRIRHFLVFGLFALASLSALPRLRAAWQLPTAATTFADYALCMAGPTAPALLRDNPQEFRKLVRRRLIASSSDERPFARCAKAARELSGSAAVERAHEASAASFGEYGADVDGPAGSVGLGDLTVTTRRLGELAQAAWPFSREGYTHLVKASAFAPEAVHPLELPRPGAARGLPPARSLARCAVRDDGSSFVLGLSTDRRVKVVRSVSSGGVVTEAPLAPPEARVFAVSCDQNEVLVAAGREGSRDVALFACAYRGDCNPVPLPRFGERGPAVRYPMDIARVDGVIVVAASMRGIVRVASSRDEGRTWTPFTVAYDPEAHPELRFDASPPDRLLVNGRRLVLHAAVSRPSATYPVLASDDAGASWHAP